MYRIHREEHKNRTGKKKYGEISIYIIVIALIGPIFLISANSVMAGVGNPAPDDVTNLTNNSFEDNYINWTWSDPININSDLLILSIYIDGQYVADVPGGVQYYNETNLIPGTQHTIGVQTLDTRGYKTDGIIVNGTSYTSNSNSSPTPTPTAIPTPVPTDTLTPIPTTTPTPTSFPIQHVVTIVFENAELSEILDQGPYFNYLYNTYGAVSNYYAPCHPSASNYLAMTSGNTWQCGSDDLNLYNTINIGTLLQRQNLSWYGFMESMPGPCNLTDSGEYVTRHNPFVYYADLVNSDLCNNHDVPLTTWDSLVNSDQIPNYSFISPNLLDDGHDTNVSYADNWLKSFLVPLLNKSWAANTVFFITFDEGSTDNGYDIFNGGHTYLVAVSPYSKGLAVSENVTAYNLQTTIEWLLNLGTAGNNDNMSVYPPLKGLFNFTGN